MICSICKLPIKEGDIITMYTEKSSNERLFAHDSCLASTISGGVAASQSEKIPKEE